MYEQIAKCIFIIPAIVATCLGFRPNEIKQVPQVKIEVAEEKAEPPSTQKPALDELINKYFPEGARAMARKIAFCESSNRENALGKNKNGSTDSGYFQINSIHRARVDNDLLAVGKGVIS